MSSADPIREHTSLIERGSERKNSGSNIFFVVYFLLSIVSGSMSTRQLQLRGVQQLVLLSRDFSLACSGCSAVWSFPDFFSVFWTALSVVSSACEVEFGEDMNTLCNSTPVSIHFCLDKHIFGGSGMWNMFVDYVLSYWAWWWIVTRMINRRRIPKPCWKAQRLKIRCWRSLSIPAISKCRLWSSSNFASTPPASSMLGS